MAIVVTHNPVRDFDTDALLDALYDVVLETTEEIIQQYEDITAAWRHEVQFDFDFIADDDIGVEVRTDDEIFGWVNDGTSPYPIFPKQADGYLRYQKEWEPKTFPGELGSFIGSRGKHGAWTVRRAVLHPGIAARDFDVMITDKFQPIFEQRIREVLLDPRFF